MTMITCARPYAKAAFNHAKVTGSLDRWEQMLLMMGALVEYPDVKTLLSYPALTPTQKVTHLTHLAGDNIDTGTRNLLNVLSENKRLLLLPWISARFVLLKAAYERVQEVTVSSAYVLGSSQEALLVEKMQQRLGKSIKINTVIDPSLIGGVKICAGDWVYDDTLKARLDKLAHAITS